MQLEIEETALKKETDHLSQDRLAALQKELAELRDDFNAKRLSGGTRRGAVDKVSKLREKIESTKNEIKTAQQNYDWKEAAELHVRRAPNLQKELESEEALLKDRDLSLVRENVGDEGIALIISRWTGIPVAKLTESERNKTLHLDGGELHKRGNNMGQDDGGVSQKVTEAIISAIKGRHQGSLQSR